MLLRSGIAKRSASVALAPVTQVQMRERLLPVARRTRIREVRPKSTRSIYTIHILHHVLPTGRCVGRRAGAIAAIETSKNTALPIGRHANALAPGRFRAHLLALFRLAPIVKIRPSHPRIFRNFPSVRGIPLVRRTARSSGPHGSSLSCCGTYVFFLLLFSLLARSWQTLRGSCSAVSKPKFAYKIK